MHIVLYFSVEFIPSKVNNVLLAAINHDYDQHLFNMLIRFVLASNGCAVLIIVESVVRGLYYFQKFSFL